jgi:hypothetical protein
VVAFHNADGFIHTRILYLSSYQRAAAAQTLCIMMSFLFGQTHIDESADNTTGYSANASAGQSSYNRASRYYRTDPGDGQCAEADQETANTADDSADASAFGRFRTGIISIHIGCILLIYITGNQANVIALETLIDKLIDYLLGSPDIII